MEHVAIMKKQWGLIPKILSREKTVESRWYKSKIAPWNRISARDIVYFKNSGEKVTAKAIVSKVLQFNNLNKTLLKELYQKYGTKIGISSKFSNWVIDKQGKNYCILIFLEDPTAIEKPFSINKAGFGNACAWIVTESISRLRV